MLLLLLLRLIMTSMLRRWRAGGDGGVGSVCRACFLLLHMAATAGTTTAASFTKTVPDASFTLSLGWLMMQGDFDVPVFPGR